MFSTETIRNPRKIAGVMEAPVVKKLQEKPLKYNREILGFQKIDLIRHGSFADKTVVRWDLVIQKILNDKGQFKIPERTRQFFTRQVQVMRQLDHPNIISCLYYDTPVRIEFGVEEYHHIIVMNNGGQDLGQVYGLDDPVQVLPSLQECFQHILQASRGLAFLHERFIFHRDIKTENILLEKTAAESVVRIADFGFAVDLRKVKEPLGYAGTVEYMAPETLESRPQSLPADVHCFGATIKELLSCYKLASELPEYDDRREGPRVTLSFGCTKKGQNLRRQDSTIDLLVTLGVQMLLKSPERRPTAAEVNSSLEDLNTRLQVSQIASDSSAQTTGPIRRKKTGKHRFNPLT